MKNKTGKNKKTTAKKTKITEQDDGLRQLEKQLDIILAACDKAEELYPDAEMTIDGNGIFQGNMAQVCNHIKKLIGDIQDGKDPEWDEAWLDIWIQDLENIS